ncbi:MAG: hypothetical protein ACM3SQ_02290 [Betaproteobacteria bacterium]
MSDSRRPPAGPVAQDGDIVVTRDPRAAARYSVRQLPGIVQFSASRDEAVRLARSFARLHAVDVWYSEKGTHRLLETYRTQTAPQARVRKEDSL